MEYIQRIEINRHMRKPLRVFLGENPLVRMKATESDLSPVEFVASCFVANLQEGEDYGDWLCRQVKDTLETELLHDRFNGSGDRADSILHQRVARVEFDAEDRQEIESLFGARPECRLIWESLKQQSRDAA